MKRAGIIFLSTLFLSIFSYGQVDVSSDTIIIDSSETYDTEENYMEEELHAPLETAYFPYFSADSIFSAFISQEVFKNDLQKEYKRLSDQLDEGTEVEQKKKNNYSWIEKLIEMFPRLNISVMLAIAKFVIYGLIVVVFFYIIKYFFYKDINWNPFKKDKNGIIQEESIEGITSEHGYENMIRNALNIGDKRLAVRYYYLWLLYKLDAHNLIKFHPEKTNSEYLYELKNVRYRTSFANLSYIYDYMWYGEAELNDQDFKRVKDNFDLTLRQIM